ncbi:MAG: response regulator [Candidatus Omnitrophica bacterium]|nr:response regulator [Candidatus Omnitrophota bacterium]
MKIKVLIVDDEKEVVESLERGLIKEGFDTVCAFDGIEAKNKILSDNPDVILLDLVMPVLDGWGVLQWLREEKKSFIPTIILSAKDGVSDMKRGYNLEADTYLVKPVSIEDVVSGIKLVCSLGAEQDRV